MIGADIVLRRFEQMKALLICQGLGSEIIKDEELHLCQLVHEAWKAAIEASKCEILEQTGCSHIECGMILSRGLSTEGAGQP